MSADLKDILDGLDLSEEELKESISPAKIEPTTIKINEESKNQSKMQSIMSKFNKLPGFSQNELTPI